MAAVHTGAAEEDAGKFRFSSIEDWIQGLASWFHLSSRHDVEHEEFRRMATDLCRGAGIIMIRCLHSWIGYDHEGVARTKDGSGPKRSFYVVVMLIHQGRRTTAKSSIVGYSNVFVRFRWGGSVGKPTWM